MAAGLVPNVFDVAALVLVLGLLVLIAYGVGEADGSLTAMAGSPISLDPWRLPEYALRTTLRMLAAMVWSLAFTFVYATVAAKSRRAEIVLIPILDILQSVPILGFLTFTVAFFMGLFPGRALGAELACIFAIFTSQAWNMTFSMYQSLRNVPKDLDEVSQSFHLSPWQRFWHLDVSFAMPGLVWNAMMSMSGGWFFVVASEAITVGDTTVTLPGVGSYVAEAIRQQNLYAVGWAVLTMLAVILVLRSVAVPADRRLGRQVPRRADGVGRSALLLGVLDLFRKTRFLRALSMMITDALGGVGRWRLRLPAVPRLTFRLPLSTRLIARLIDGLWLAVVIVGTFYIGFEVVRFVGASLGLSDVGEAVGKGVLTLIRVLVLIALATLVWVPIGVWGGPQAARCRAGAALGAVPRRLPGQHRLPRRGDADRQLQSQRQHLAEPADDPGHPVVHPVQRHRRRQRLPLRPQGRRRQLPRHRLALVAQRHPAGHLPLLRHRRHQPPRAARGTPPSSPRRPAGAATS